MQKKNKQHQTTRNMHAENTILHTECMTDDIAERINHINRLSTIDMRYVSGVNNTQTGKRRQEMTAILAARFGAICPRIIAWLYGITHRGALEHLAKQVKQGLLIQVRTFRSVDGLVYTPTTAGAKFAEELTGMPMHFRRKKPGRECNENVIMHNLINCVILLMLLSETLRQAPDTLAFNGIVTEPETMRLLKGSTHRVVDGFVVESAIDDAQGYYVIAIEIEHSFKEKAIRAGILLQYLKGIREGLYSKVFMFSHSLQTLNDIKRFHKELFIEMPQQKDKATGRPLLDDEDVALLKSCIIYRTKFCESLMNMFYP